MEDGLARRRGLSQCQRGLVGGEFADDLPAVPGHCLAGRRVRRPPGGQGRVAVELDVHAAEEGPVPGVHDGGQRRLRRRVVPDAGADGDLQDQGFRNRRAWPGSLALPASMRIFAVRLIWSGVPQFI